MMFASARVILTLTVVAVLTCGALAAAAAAPAPVGWSTFDARDLLEPHWTPPPPNADEAEIAAAPRPTTKDREQEVAVLVGTIHAGVSPSVEVKELNGYLYVKGTDADRQYMDELLKRLREGFDIQITTESEVFVVPESVLKEAGVVWAVPRAKNQPLDKKPPSSNGDDPGIALLSDLQVAMVRKAFLVAQSPNLRMPRVTAINGFFAWTAVGLEPPYDKATDSGTHTNDPRQGCVFSVRSTMNRDRKNITSLLHLTLWNPQPNGKTVRLDARTVVSMPDRDMLMLDLGPITGPLRIEGVKDAAPDDAVRRVVAMVKSTIVVTHQPRP